MNKLLSYCFFKPLILPQNRTWDKDWDKHDRYYYNIPAVLLTNRILYPDYKTLIFVTPNIYENPLSRIFKIFENESLELAEIDFKYSVTEPMVLRMVPLWEPTDIFHTRDLDSVPTETEYRYLRCFEQSSCTIGTIRTHQNHYGRGCRMLGGLSSFKPREIPASIKGPSFIEYFKKGHYQYGCDQDLLISNFTNTPEYTKDFFYDCMAYRQKNQQDFPCQTCSQNDLNCIEVEPEKQTLFDTLKSSGLDVWAGEPIDARGAYTEKVLAKFNNEKKAIEQDSLLRDFYLS